MRILAIETSGRPGGIALAETARPDEAEPTLREEVSLDEALRHARDLLPALRDACRRLGWPPRRIDLVALSIGPGSFTGLRIGLTVAKVMAWDAGSAVVPVPSLRALAENAPPDRPRVACLRDAKRGGLYAAVFERREGGRLVETFGPALVAPAELARRLPAGTLLLGWGVPKAREALAGFEAGPEEAWDVRPAVVARLGWRLWREGREADPMRLEPVYLRRPEAEDLWERRHGSGPTDG